jgi:hypothetical protein
MQQDAGRTAGRDLRLVVLLSFSLHIVDKYRPDVGFNTWLAQQRFRIPVRASTGPNRPDHVTSMVITVLANALGSSSLPEPLSHPRLCPASQHHQPAFLRHVVVAFQDS